MATTGTVTRKRVLHPHSVFDEPQLRALFAEHSVNPHHINSIYRHIIQNNAESFDAIPELPIRILPLLKANFVFSTSTIASRKDASDNSTTKLVVELQDGQQVETVIMRYGEVELNSFPKDERERRIKELEKEGKQFKSNKRATVCISSQVGCAMGCTFCATGTMGLLSNLTTGEIIEQLVHANKIEKIRNVVFMGMGEPLDNYDAVLGAIQAMINTARFCLSPSRITVSTVGVAPRITSLMKDVPQIGLALSLHAPTQELRSEIVPSSKSFSLTKILQSVFAFIENQNKLTNSNVRHILVEYVLIQDINSSSEVAHQLGQLFADRVAKKDILVNIIPYNPTDVIANYQRPTPETLKNFVEIVRSYGVYTLIRQELGQDIASACGQLVVKGPKKVGECAGDVEDLGKKAGGSGKGTPVVKRANKKDSSAVAVTASENADTTPDALSSPWVIGGIAVGLGLFALGAVRLLKKK
ncbi:UNVERIFIED_CONTAM: sorting nexin [Siphonaria sp. JEL0065]|nr:sorting nexin [Siphonaria sp. JEL0065]